MTTLTGMTWQHPRGYDSLMAASTAFAAIRPEIELVWEARSLQDFADFPLSELTDRYDLLVFDHPFVGEVAVSHLLVPLDEVLPGDFLSDQHANSVGRSHESYQWDDHQWALAIDAACHVSACRPDLVTIPPADWEEVLAFARESRTQRKAGVAIPAKPIDAFLALLTLVANQIGEPFLPDGGLADLDTTTTALESLAQLLESCHPASLSSNPIDLLELLTNTDELSYLPITFGYVTYATPGVRRHPASFDALPRGPRGSAGGVLGGAGLGISASSKHLAQAAAFASFVASPTVQAGAYTVGGGQPGHRSAWLDPGVNRHHGDFFAATLNGIDESYLRPRWPGYLSAQTAAAKAVHAWLTDRHTPAAAVVRTLDALFSTTFASSVSQLANLNPNSFSTH